MRTIKFRILIGFEDEAREWSYWDFSDLFDDEWYISTQFHDRNSLSQFTGLKDKNGKEIYEGDLVSVWEDKSRPFIVEYKHCGFNLPDNDIFLEVIGNIYENPELLTSNQ